MNLEFMKYAISLAKNTDIDIPVGAVIVKNDEIIASGTNKREQEQQTINHAEMLAIQNANQVLKNWRLQDCEMYVTLEPCPMCASAIVQARIKSVYFGAYDMLNGAFGSKTDMRLIMNSSIEVKGGFLESECGQLLKDYFKKLR